jgi:galactokinase
VTEIDIDLLVANTREEFRARTGGDCRVAFAPGRVNLIGEHTDYNDGFVLPMAIQLGVAVAYRPTDDGRLTAHSVDEGSSESAPLDALQKKARHGWFTYVAGVAHMLRESGVASGGVELTIHGSVPRGAGLSSSAALEMATARALVDVAGAAWDPVAAALVCQRAENDFVGVPCGIMDQMASACSAAGSALLIDCRSLAHQAVAIPPELAVVVIDSGARRRLASSEYADRRSACQRAVAIIQTKHPEVRALRDVTRRQLEESPLDDLTRRRALHVIEEIDRVAAFVSALGRRDHAAAGALLDASHESLRSLYEVSSDALDAIVARARSHPACFGARMTGAGFGGCALALVRVDATEDFIGKFSRTPQEQQEQMAFVAHPVGGAMIAG